MSIVLKCVQYTKTTSVLILVALSMVIFSNCNNTPKLSPIEEEVSANTTPKILQGVLPSDMHESLEEKRFEIKKTQNDKGYSSVSTLNEVNIQYTVELFGREEGTIEVIRATSDVEKAGIEPRGTYNYFRFISSIPYEGADPEKAAVWIEENFNTDKATITIGGAKFTLLAPSPYVRTLKIIKI